VGVDEEEVQGLHQDQCGVDTKTRQVVSLDGSLDQTSDREKLKSLVRKARKKVKVKKALGDGSYNSHDNFKFLASEGIEPGIKVREDSIFEEK